jgi:glycosyltransferase involved in cell wall biosynthesis
MGPAQPAIAYFIGALANKISLLVFGKRIDYRHSEWYAKTFARLFKKKLKSIQCDVVLAVGGSEFIAYLDYNRPLILVADRTIGGAIGYHGILSKLWKWSERQSIETDKRAMQKTVFNIFASTWAGEGATSQYALDNTKNIVLPFGANLNELPEEAALLNRSNNTETVRLLFVGREWENKGGPTAVACLHDLRERNINAQLHVVGCMVPAEVKNEHIIEHGFLDKNNPVDFEKLNSLYLSSHFFILPTKFEAYGLVFAEAAAYGLPSLGPNTGGVSSAMCNGATGKLLPINAEGKEYATQILHWWNDKEAYKIQIIQSRKMYVENLTWDAWAEKFLALLNQSLLKQ